jgi:hypothetical protein
VQAVSSPDQPATTESVAQAERGVLGALILDCLRFREIRGRLAPDDFAVYQHRVVYECIEAIVSRDAAVDYVGLSAELEQRGRLEAFGGLGFLIELGNSVTSPAFLLSHVAVVLEASQRRKLEASALSVVKEVRQGKPIEEIALPERPATFGTVKVKRRQFQDPGPLPDDLCAPGGLLGKITSWINATAIREQPILTLGNVTAALGAVFGRRYRTPTNLRTSVYCVGIAPTGAGKEHSRSQIKALFTKAGLGKLLGGERLASGPGLLAAMHRSESSLFMLDEFGSFMQSVTDPKAQSYLRTVMDILLQLYSSSGTVFNGSEYASQDEDNPRIDIVEPNPCLWGTSTPSTFYASLSSQRVLDGYLGRFVVFATSVPRPARRIRADMAPPVSLVDALKRAYEAGLGGGAFRGLNGVGVAIANDPKVVSLSADAARYLDSLDAEVDLALAEREHNGTSALWQRAEENTLRLALIHAISREPYSPAIETEDVDWAARIVCWSIQHLEHACAEFVSDSPFEHGCKRILALITKEGVSLTSVVRATQSLEPHVRSEMIENLEDAGLIRTDSVKTGRRGPKARMLWLTT